MVEQNSDLQIYSKQKDYVLLRPVIFDAREEGFKALLYNSNCHMRQSDPTFKWRSDDKHTRAI